VIENLKNEGLSILSSSKISTGPRVADHVHVLSAPGRALERARMRSGGTRKSSSDISDCEGNQMKRIAVVGVGLLGSAVASRLLAGGFTVNGVRPPVRSAGRARIARLKAASSLNDAAAGAQAVFTILPSADSVEGSSSAPAGCSVLPRWPP